MRTLNVSIADSEYKRFGMKRNQLTFSDLIDILKRELAKESQIKEHEMVVSTAQINNVPKGSIGTVVHVYPTNDAYEVEFIIAGESIVETALKTQIKR